MNEFVENIKNWFIETINSFVGGLIVPAGSIILVSAAVITVAMGIVKLRSQRDDFKGYFIASGACIAGAVVLASIWAWGKAAAGL